MPSTSALLLALLPAAAASEPTLQQILDATDDALRGASSHATLEMQVKTARYERTLTLEAWSEGTEKTLIRILTPEKDAGITTLKVQDNIWNYLPKVDRTMKLPAGMMSGSWMGSHFTNDDLVRESRLAEDYTATLTRRPADHPDRVYEITLVPKPDAPVVWGKQVLTVREDLVPVRAVFYDEKGGVARTLTWSDVRAVGARQVPATMTLVPGDAPEELTRVSYTRLEFDLDVPDSTFTLQSLRP